MRGLVPTLKVLPLGGLGEIGRNMTVVDFSYKRLGRRPIIIPVVEV